MATTFFPDVSNYQAGLSLAGASAVIIKATQGTTYRDPYYQGFKAQAMSLGIPYAAYHWLDSSDAGAQARFAFSVVGASVPLMIDDEQGVINVNHTLAFINAYRAAGGKVTLEYAPQWVWAASGRPNLKPIADAGLAFVSSNYTAYSDTGPGWAPYGGITPTIWQYTDSQLFNGYRVDFNAFKGTVDQLRVVFNGGTTEAGMSTADAVNAAAYATNGSNSAGYPPGDPATVGVIVAHNNKAMEDRLNKRLDALEVLIRSIPAGGGAAVDYDRIEKIVDTQLDQQSMGGADND